MKGTFIFGFMLLSVLVGSQGFAQAVDQPAQHIDGKSLSTPEQERAAKDAMNTPSGQMGKDEPGTHELRESQALKWTARASIAPWNGADHWPAMTHSLRFASRRLSARRAR